MAGEWRALGELVENFDSTRVPVREADRRPGSYPYYGASGVVDHVHDFLFDGEYLLVAEDGENLRTRTTPIAFLATGRFWVNNHAHIIRGNTEADTRYLMYALRNTDISGYLTGSTMPKLTQGNLNRIPVRCPAIQEQRAIAHILGTLDDKIELNRQMSEAPESMARALFKSWFIDFDPVRAKAEGRDPCLPTPLADLFPARLVDSDLGAVPEGWDVNTLADHCEAVKGVSYKGDGLGDDGMPLHNLNSVYEGGGYKYDGIKHYSGEYAARHVVNPGDLIVANTEQGQQRRLIGCAALVPSTFGNEGIASHHIYRLRPKTTSPLTPAYLCWLLNSPRMHDIVSGYANGTTVTMLPLDGVQKPAVVCPPKGLVDAFDSFALQAARRRDQTISESRALAALRDELLSPLIAGELPVRGSAVIRRSIHDDQMVGRS